MPTTFQFHIPQADGRNVSVDLPIGSVLYLVGANGCGKSSLVTHFVAAHQGSARRISAHRQTWLAPNALDMTTKARAQVEHQIRSRDASSEARYRLDYSSERTSLALYDLTDAEAIISRTISDLVRAGDLSGATAEADKPAPISSVNELLRLSGIPIEISLAAGNRVLAKKRASNQYDVAELSDGERAALLIASEVLTANAGTLFLIDEPERHLHRSIASPLIKLLFQRRTDCAFVVSTHDLTLPIDTPGASVLLVRECQCEGKRFKSWSVDLLGNGEPIDEELKRDVFGARRKIVFVEGEPQ